MNNRIGNKWTVNEVLSLQREYELLGWSVDQIAIKHRRTANAIMYKLHQEGFADYNDLYHKLNRPVSHSSSSDNIKISLSDESEEACEEDHHRDEEPLSSRVSKLETDLSEIKDMLKVLTSSLKPTQYGSNGVGYQLYL
jgi:hypothetical protein